MDSFGGLGSTVVVTGTSDGVKDDATHRETLDTAQQKEKSPRQDGESWPAAERFLGLSDEDWAKSIRL